MAMEVHKTIARESLIFFWEGRLDVTTVSLLQEELIRSIISPNGYRHIILDLAKLKYISSAGMRAIVAAQKVAADHKKLLTLCNVPEEIRKILDLAGVLNILSIQETPLS